MVLRPLAASFAAVADVYDRGRPEYAPAVVGAIAAELNVAGGERVLDLAAGTGKLSRALAAAERVLDHLRSMSWIAALAEREREQHTGEIARLIAAGETPAQFPVRAQTGLSSRL
ncbi:MAG TPA: hypothetical protein VFN55_05480 [Solirubrobacteraceae bacterium]|nr:hypothetical protein [Solirubrobacteraceae bacterium]